MEKVGFENRESREKNRKTTNKTDKSIDDKIEKVAGPVELLLEYCSSIV